MKKEEFQNSQQGTASAENKGKSPNQPNNQTTNISNDQRNEIAHHAGLGRDRMADVEDLGNMSGEDDYSGGDSDDLRNEDLNAANDQ